MRLRTRYLLWVNGPLLLLLLLYALTQQWSGRRDMLRLETRSLQNLGEALRATGFAGARSRPTLATIVSTAARLHPGVEIMVLDQRSVVRVSSVVDRVGKRWHEPDIVEVLRRGHAVTWKSAGHFHGDVEMLDITVPVPSGPAPPRYAIHVARRMDLVERLLRERRVHHTLWALGSILIIGLTINLVTLRWLIRPVNRITAQLAVSRWHRPGGDHGGDELQSLVETIDHLVSDAEDAVTAKDRLLGEIRSFNEKLEDEVQRVRHELTRAQIELVGRERLAAVGELAAGLAHEIRNPLHIIRGATDLVARQGDCAEACQEIREEVDRVNRLVNDLLAYSRPTTPSAESIEVAPVIRAACNAAALVDEAEVDWQIDCAEDLELEIDADHLRQLLVNLLSNAIESTLEQDQLPPRSAAVTVRGWRADDHVCLAIRDAGRGVDGDDLSRLFLPFFSRRPGGTGLGLAIVRRLVDLYGGAIEVRSTPGHGTEMLIRIPARQARTQPCEPASDGSHHATE